MNKFSVPVSDEAKSLMETINQRCFAEAFTNTQQHVDDLWRTIQNPSTPRGRERNAMIEDAIDYGRKVNEYRDETAEYAARLDKLRPLDQWTEDHIGDATLKADYVNSGDILGWLAGRKTGFGGSDIGDLLGVTHGKFASTPAEVVEEKATLDLDIYSAAQNIYTKDMTSGISGPLARGNAWEGVIAHMYQDNMTPEQMEPLTGKHDLVKVLEAKATFRGSYDWQTVNVDGLLCSSVDSDGLWVPDGILEVKTASVLKFWMKDGKVVIPPYYHAQVLNYLDATGFEYGQLIALIGDNDVRIFDVRKDDSIDGFGTFADAKIVLDDLWSQVLKLRRKKYGKNWEEYMLGMADRAREGIEAAGGVEAVYREAVARGINS